MRLYDRYICSRMVGPFFMGLGGFVVLIVGHLLYQSSELIIQSRIPAGPVLEMICLAVPEAAVMALPVSTLLAAALTLNALARDNEFVPLRAAGLTSGRLQRPVLLFGAATMVGTFFLAESVVPWTKRATITLATQLIRTRRTLALKPGRFIAVGGGSYFYAQSVDNRTETVDGLIAVTVPGKDYPVLIQARKAILQGEECEFFDAVIYHVFERQFITRGLAAHGRINLPQLITSLTQQITDQEQFSLRELRHRLKSTQRGTDPRVRRYALELHSRLAMPVACLIFAFVAGPLTLRFARGEALVGVLITIMVVFLYFVAMLWMKTLGVNGRLQPLIAAWAPNVLFVVVGLLSAGRQR